MGLCFSKKEAASSPTPNEKKAEKPPQRSVEAAIDKKPVFVITHSAKNSGPAAADPGPADDKAKKKGETPTKKASRDVEAIGAAPVLAAVPAAQEFVPAAVVRTSSCTKEEVDAILIQCGRLSRSSSVKDGIVVNRKYSGSKRSYDFDSEKKGEEEEEEGEEKPVSRPSPHRRTPGRERSGSRERGSSGGGGRRVSRSPGRRSEVLASSGTASERSKQPTKMMAVPAREKGRGVSPAAPNKRGGESGAVRSASPRSRSPATTARVSNENASYNVPPTNQPQSLSRSSSRKAEQSPYRRNPMAEIDENCLRANQNLNNNNNSNKIQKTREDEEGTRKLSQPQAQKTSEISAQTNRSLQRSGAATEFTNAAKSSNNVVNDCVCQQLMGCGTKEEEAMEKSSSKVTELSNLGLESQNPRTISRTRSSRRSSRDLDHALGLNQEAALLNPNSYASLLLEDIQNFHQQHPNTAFSLPACVSKACSILEAVADLNSSSSENKSYAGDHSSNGRRGLTMNHHPFVESEVIAKDDLMEPSLHKYVTVRDLGGGGGGGDVEPQESAGSNSFVGQPWASSAWEPNSADSTDRYWTSRSNNGDEVEQQEAKPSPLSHHSHYHHQQQQRQMAQESETRGRMSRGVASNSSSHPVMSSENKREVHHRAQLHRAGSGGAKAGGRAHSLQVSAAAAAAAAAASS